MKEAYRPTSIEAQRPPVVSQQISRGTLTVRPQNEYSGREGILFMAENTGDIAPRPTSPSPRPEALSSAHPAAELTPSAPRRSEAGIIPFDPHFVPDEPIQELPLGERINNKELQLLARDFETREKLEPLTVEELKNEHRKVGSFVGALVDEGIIKFDDGLAGDQHALQGVILDRMEKQGVDIDKFLEEERLRYSSANSGFHEPSPVGVGAAVVSRDSITNPELAREMRSLNTLLDIENEKDYRELSNHLREARKAIARLDLPVADEPQREVAQQRIKEYFDEVTRQAAEEAKLDPRRRETMPSDITKDIEEYRKRLEDVRKISNAKDRRDAIDLLEAEAEATGLLGRLKELLDNETESLDSLTYPQDLLNAASLFRETREKLISDIIFKPFENRSETNQYHIDQYANTRLNTLKEAAKRDDPERYENIQVTETAAQLFHGTSAIMITGDMEQIVRYIQVFNHHHFAAMQRITGISEVMRLYEQNYQDKLARDKSILNNADIHDQVKKDFEAMCKTGLVTSEYGGRSLENWEIERAINTGRTFYTITFRAAEQIATGRVPAEAQYKKDAHGHNILDEHGHPIKLREEFSAEKRYASFPQESAVRLMNWIQWMTWRFDIAPTKGGMEFLSMLKERYKEHMREKKSKLGINKIKELGGLDIEEMEYGGVFGISGIYSGWRMETMMFHRLAVNVDFEGQTLRQWYDSHKGAIGDIKSGHGHGHEASMYEKQKALVTELKPLIDNSHIALGMLLKQGWIGGEEGYEVRKLLWGKTAKENVPLMMDYLTNIKFQPGETPVKKLDTIFNDNGITNQEKRDDFRRKMVLLQQINVKRWADKNPDDPKWEAMQTKVEEDLTDEEKAVRKTIMEEGEKLAPHLADIAFPYMPFMNDMPFESLDYSGPGEKFLSRRGGDLAQFKGAQDNFTSILSNPGGMGPEEFLKSAAAVAQGIEGPNGSADAQDRTSVIVEVWMDFNETKPKYRQMVVKGVMEELQRPTSTAQEYAGMLANSLNETQLRTMLEDAHKMGIIGHIEAEKLKKKKDLGWRGILKALFRDMFWVPAYIATKEFFDEIGLTKGGGGGHH